MIESLKICIFKTLYLKNLTNIFLLYYLKFLNTKGKQYINSRNKFIILNKLIYTLKCKIFKGYKPIFYFYLIFRLIKNCKLSKYPFCLYIKEE